MRSPELHACAAVISGRGLGCLLNLLSRIRSSVSVFPCRGLVLNRTFSNRTGGRSKVGRIESGTSWRWSAAGVVRVIKQSGSTRVGGDHEGASSGAGRRWACCGRRMTCPMSKSQTRKNLVRSGVRKLLKSVTNKVRQLSPSLRRGLALNLKK
ncbi:hypothetical protein EDB86DRAFT_403193 [Lactarius hatsudake]|nr:hypothetical protein EDB86DRAFT_1015614 [Lactarius hatsudake]KAH9001841.1 hypothetical protein EDB86DRAFT_403193 [Lactarius hatsudake]